MRADVNAMILLRGCNDGRRGFYDMARETLYYKFRLKEGREAQHILDLDDED